MQYSEEEQEIHHNSQSATLLLSISLQRRVQQGGWFGEHKENTKWPTREINPQDRASRRGAWKICHDQGRKPSRHVQLAKDVGQQDLELWKQKNKQITKW